MVEDWSGELGDVRAAQVKRGRGGGGDNCLAVPFGPSSRLGPPNLADFSSTATTVLRSCVALTISHMLLFRFRHSTC